MNVQQAGYTAEFQSRTEQNYQVGTTTSTAPQQSGTSAKTVTFEHRSSLVRLLWVDQQLHFYLYHNTKRSIG